MRRSFLLLSLIAVILLGLMLMLAQPALAHANLLRSDPVAGSALDAAPEHIRLWFTEPLEPGFSSIHLLDSSGNPVSAPTSTVDATDASLMTLEPGALADGLYTVSWRAVSAADGHITTGSYAFAVGMAGVGVLAAPDTEAIPPYSAHVRWFDLLTLALMIGGTAFVVCVAFPTEHQRPLHRLIVWGWRLSGVAALFLLVFQTVQVTGQPLPGALTSLGAVLTGTRFGGLWLARMVVWLVLGAALARQRYGIALASGAVILLLHALYSHASVTYDLLPSVAGDWLHLAASVLWVGGLAQFINLLSVQRAEAQPLLPLVARFSQFARICVAALIVTGLYAAWLEVGSVAALTNTLYGRALMVKLILFAPLLLTAAVNLVLTPRGLRSGSGAWASRLRGFIGLEIALAVGIFAAVGVMASADPARASLARRLPIPDNSYADYQIADDMHIHFNVTPGWVGQNEFIVQLLNLDGSFIDDASLIRVRLTNQTQRVGESELRPQQVGNGEYRIIGANLSVPGIWRARVSVQRPDKFDALADFSLEMTLPPVPSGLDMGAPLEGRQWALIVTGLALLAVGGFAGGRGKFRPLRDTGLLVTATLVVGMILVLGAVA